MRSIRPLIESSASERGRELLRAARADRPLPRSAQRTLAALGVAAGASTVSAGVAAAASSAKLGLGAGAAGSGAASLPLLAAKWLLVGTIGGVTLASGARFVFPEARPSASPPSSARTSAPRGAAERPGASAALQLPATKATPAEPAPTAPRAAERSLPSAAPPLAPLAPFEAEPQTPAAPSQAAFDAPQHKLLHDIGLLDAARRALRSGNAAQALGELDHYEAARQTRTLDQEAQLLRIDALLASGQRERARQLARSYLSASPSDVHSARLRALLAD